MLPVMSRGFIAVVRTPVLVASPGAMMPPLRVMALAMLPVPARTSPVTVTADGPVAEFVGPTVLAKSVPALMTVPRV